VHDARVAEHVHLHFRDLEAAVALRARLVSRDDVGLGALGTGGADDDVVGRHELVVGDKILRRDGGDEPALDLLQRLAGVVGDALRLVAGLVPCGHVDEVGQQAALRRRARA
jgi:hypothetical protein